MNPSFVLGLFVAALVTLIPSQSSSVTIGSYTVSLSSDPSSVIVARPSSSPPTTYPLPHALRELRHGAISPSGRLTVVGRADDGEVIVVLSPEAGKLLGTVRAASAAISADGRFAVWARHQSGTTVAPAEYYAANVDQLPAPANDVPASLPGRLLYPEPSSGLHALASGIERVDDSTFAFLDFSQQARVTRVVVVRLSETESPVVVAKPLNPTDFADVSDTSAAATPGRPAISRADGEGLLLRVDFAPVSAATQGRTAKIRMW